MIAIFRRDGTFAEGPIALCEFKGMYAAKTAASELAKMFGAARARELLANKHKHSVVASSKRFGATILAFPYATGAGRKQPVGCEHRTRGIVFFAGIATQEHARRVAMTLTDEHVLRLGHLAG